jgi:lysophospholipid hydrolase
LVIGLYVLGTNQISKIRVNFSTVASVRVSDGVPPTAFTYELFHLLHAFIFTLPLTSDYIHKSFGSSIGPDTSWLAQQAQHNISLYQCDMNFTPWTQQCFCQADCILIVGLADKGIVMGKNEEEIEH